MVHLTRRMSLFGWLLATPLLYWPHYLIVAHYHFLQEVAYFTLVLSALISVK